MKKAFGYIKIGVCSFLASYLAFKVAEVFIAAEVFGFSLVR